MNKISVGADDPVRPEKETINVGVGIDQHEKNKGITLVALVITIIVLIILAGVSIRAVMNGGLIINAKGAKENWDIAKVNESNQISFLTEKIEGKHIESEINKITLEKARGETLKNYRIYGKTEEAESVGDIVTEGDRQGEYKIQVTVRGKNLWLHEKLTAYVYNYFNTRGTNPCVYLEAGKTYTYTVCRETTGAFRLVLTFFKDENAEHKGYNAYTNNVNDLPLSYKGGGFASSYVGYQEGGVQGVRLLPNGDNAVNKYVITLKNSEELGMNGIYVGTYISSNYDASMKLQIEEGNTSTEYEPYYEPVIKEIYLREPLRNVDNVADYIDFKNKKVVRYVKEENGELIKLETPTEEAIDLPEIPTFNGTTKITVETKISPSKIEVNYE